VLVIIFSDDLLCYFKVEVRRVVLVMKLRHLNHLQIDQDRRRVYPDTPERSYQRLRKKRKISRTG